MTTMTLAEAIRLGAMLKPQGRDTFLDGLGRTCALGAAIDALGMLDAYAVVCLSDLFPILNAVSDVACPVTGEHFTLFTVITGLNDRHMWTRARIADWIEGIERAQPRVGTVDELSEHAVTPSASAAK